MPDQLSCCSSHSLSPCIGIAIVHPWLRCFAQTTTSIVYIFASYHSISFLVFFSRSRFFLLLQKHFFFLSLSLSTSDLLPNQNLSAFPITLGREKEKAQNDNNNRKNEKKAASNLLEWTRGKNKVIMIYRFVLQKKDKIQLSRVR